MKANALAILLLCLPAMAVVSSCPDPVTTYEGSFRVRRVVIDQPFKLVAIMNSLIDGQQSALDAQLVGKPFNESTARQGQRELDNALALLPFIAGSVKIKVTSILIEQCAGSELDLRYKIFAAVVPISSARIGEAVSTIF